MAETEQDTNTTDEAGHRSAETDAQANTEAAVEQGAIVAETDDNGAVKGYLGKDAADLRSGDAETIEAGLTVPEAVTAAKYRDPVPPGGHPADPTSTTAVGALADDQASLDKADATRK